MSSRQAGSYVAGAPANPKAALRINFLKKVYGLFTASLVVSSLGAMCALYIGAPDADEVAQGRAMPPVVELFADHPILSMGVVFGVMFGARAVRRIPGVNVLALFGMAALLGVTTAPALYMAQVAAGLGGTLSSAPVRDTFILTVLTFGSLTLGVFLSKEDLSFLASGLVMGAMVVLGAMLLNVLLGSTLLGLAISSVSVLVFGGYVLYNTSRLLRSDDEDPVGGALDLYLNFIALFSSILQILSGRHV
ncbi:Bax inhibitor-1/YccA family protein [Sorangium sp. So ce1014]|uniref:Bax inhibitor-1/YccA family protein n=1 Tax=Sorangium sp. So ce1014 TaxID=3133326 RepID=UPI003F5E4C0D